MTPFIETNSAQFSRWESDIDQMKYLISAIRFDKTGREILAHLQSLREKAERLQREIMDFSPENSEGHSKR